MSLREGLNQNSVLQVQQKYELSEILFEFETRNKYAVETDKGIQIGFIAEQQKGLLGFLFRQFLGHWRSFELHFFDTSKQLVMRASHPFRFFFQRLEVLSAEGSVIGVLQQRFSLFYKSFDVLGPLGELLFTVRSPIWRIWTFEFQLHGRVLAKVEKKWSGIFAEVVTDKDNFRIQYLNVDLSEQERVLVLAASIFIDLIYFEKKAR